MIIDIKDLIEINSNSFIVFDNFMENITNETSNIFCENGLIKLQADDSKYSFEAEFDMDIKSDPNEEIKIGLFVNDNLITASQRTVSSDNEENFQHVNISSKTSYVSSPQQICLAIKNLSNLPIKIKNIYYEIE